MEEQESVILTQRRRSQSDLLGGAGTGRSRSQSDLLRGAGVSQTYLEEQESVRLTQRGRIQSDLLGGAGSTISCVLVPVTVIAVMVLTSALGLGA